MMHIALAAPIDLRLLDGLDFETSGLPVTYSFPFTATLANEYQMRGHKVSVIALSLSTEQSMHLRVSDSLDIFVGPYRARARQRVPDGFKVERTAVASAIAAANPDVVHAHWSYEFAQGALASGYPCLVTSHDWSVAVLRYHRDLYRLFRVLMQIRTLTTAPHMTVPSPYMARPTNVVRRIALKSPAVVVPNGVSAGPTAESATTPSDDNDCVQLICVSNGFNRRKNTGTLLTAFALMRKSFESRNAQLLLVGHEHEVGGPAWRWAEKRHLLEAVSFHGSVSTPEVMRLMSQSDLLIVPSKEESFGMVAIEAMSMGLPVLAGEDTGALTWVLDGGRAGYLCADVGDPTRLCESLLYATHDSTPSEIRLQARLRVESLFSTRAVTSRYLQILEEIR